MRSNRSPGNHQILAQAIIDLYRMPVEKRIAMGRRGFLYAEEHRQIPSLVNQLEQIFTDLCKSN